MLCPVEPGRAEMKHETFSEQPEFRAENLLLRAPRRSDAGLIGHYAGDPRVARFTRSIPHPLPPGAAEAFVARALAADRSEDVWVIDGAGGGLGEVLGVVALDRLGRARSEIGYWVAPALWNGGIASQAVEALLAANPHNCRSIVAEVFQDNPASARVLTRAGFDYLGDADTFCVARGAMVPVWTYLRRLGPG